ncbi:transcription antitermination factor NusG [Rhodoblastus acidophilus]|uniref:transcription termination/antitermination protein NusG n=1 Tax=Rhodoblastus acidophilus TaxID=1074 RepID=UPI0022240400|nr:transcription termination/antitermination NusG family protein [Rhodoblastus acidophilus]MCW2319245.1 transcription antitermination factor NusG [Rhodoblastus acidophilus]
MVAKFWGVAGLKTGIKALGERREFPFGRQSLPEPVCNAAAREGLEAAGFEVFAPAIVEQRWRSKRNGERVKAKNAAFPLFPGYVFFGWNDFDHWCEAPHARGVSDVLRDGDKFSRPALVSRRTMLALLAAGPLIDSLVAARPAGALEVFDVGQRVTIKSGPFTGMIARILSFKGKKRMKAFLELEALQQAGRRQAFDLEVETCELTKKTA